MLKAFESLVLGGNVVVHRIETRYQNRQVVSLQHFAELGDIFKESFFVRNQLLQMALMSPTQAVQFLYRDTNIFAFYLLVNYLELLLICN
jgi:hypothetical protein